MTGQRFGRLVVLKELPARHGHKVFRAKCDCGRTVEVRRDHFTTTRSCGCLHVQHGHSSKRQSPTYLSWKNMRQRCSNPNAFNYANYGGRGVTVCERWKWFKNFLADMGERPAGKTIDRIDVEGNYEPVNIHRRITVDPRGKIKSGMKATNAQGKEYPKSLDYFNIVGPDPKNPTFPELVRAYGTKPSSLILVFPTNNIPDFFDQNFLLYAQKGGDPVKVRTCDGETCLHRISENVEGKTYGAGEESACICKELPEDHKKRCRYNCYFKAWVVIPEQESVNNPACYLFETGSINSGSAVYSELEKIKGLNGGILFGVFFRLSVKMISGRDDANLKFPIWTLQAVGMLDEIQARTKKLFAAGAVAQLPVGKAEATIEAAQEVPETAPPQQSDTFSRLSGDLDSIAELLPWETREKVEAWEKKHEAEINALGATEQRIVKKVVAELKGERVELPMGRCDRTEQQQTRERRVLCRCRMKYTAE